MRLRFDRGTVLLEGMRDPAALAEVPGLLWDSRVAAYRAPGFRHAEVASALARGGVRFSDEVRPVVDAPQPWHAIDLRTYQREALDAWRRAGERGVVVLPTGSGKTRVGLAAMASLARPALCVVPTRVLMEQWCRELAATYGGPIGRYGDGSRELAAITVATYESAYRHMDVLGNRFELIIVDEAHHFGNGVRDEVLEMAVAPARLGLTATPVADGPAAERVIDLIGPTVYDLRIGDLAGTFLAELEVVTVGIDLTDDERARYARLVATFRPVFASLRRHAPDATWSELTAAAARTNEGRVAVRAWREARRLVSLCTAKRGAVGELLARHRDARVLVFVADNEAAYAISREQLVMPLTCDIGRVERAAALERFRRGELRALISARVLNEGLDVPDADVAIIAGAALGEREHVQRVGRLLRPAPGKRAVVYELIARGTSEVGQAFRRRRGLVARSAARLPHPG